jgi:hypothetical protein
MGACGCGSDGDESESSAVVARRGLNSSTIPVSSPFSVATTADVPSTSQPSSGTSSMVPDDRPPPALSVDSQSGRFEVGAFQYSTATMTADGTMPTSGPPVAEGATAQLVYPEPGWNFKAVAHRERGDRGRRLNITVIDEHRFDVAPPPGSYEIWVDGAGSTASAVFVFRWVVFRD